MTGVSESSQQSSNLKDEGYIPYGFQDALRRPRERIPGNIDNSVTGVSECSQQRSNLKDSGYKSEYIALTTNISRFIIKYGTVDFLISASLSYSLIECLS
ncbi:hypothetical protein PAU_03862 [Photorhabdus asymbiotica]|uniref:Uncharacterized protein n=2 Tax=Photorhabdus asymbiotica TaxID=291112 RepID=C7BN95_PHOAA|nr:hypothetical protein [Photorhabdus asymbiotica]RKS59804.1 hypothetical protein BDD30_1893 [Photorhabdus asymbiotica]CAQ85950.1 hypothetical protein PAU_03862 [Photorhabdus asymbiotica]